MEREKLRQSERDKEMKEQEEWLQKKKLAEAEALKALQESKKTAPEIVPRDRFVSSNGFVIAFFKAYSQFALSSRRVTVKEKKRHPKVTTRHRL